MQRGQHPRAVNIQQISTSKQSGAALRTSLQMDVVDDPAHWVPQAWFETGATLITSSPLFNTMDGRPSELAEVIDDAGSQVLEQQPMIAAGTILRCSSAEVDGARIEYFPTSQHTISYSWAENFPTSQHTISYSRWFDCDQIGVSWHLVTCSCWQALTYKRIVTRGLGAVDDSDVYLV